MDIRIIPITFILSDHGYMIVVIVITVLSSGFMDMIVMDVIIIKTIMAVVLNRGQWSWTLSSSPAANSSLLGKLAWASPSWHPYWENIQGSLTIIVMVGYDSGDDPNDGYDHWSDCNESSAKSAPVWVGQPSTCAWGTIFGSATNLHLQFQIFISAPKRY